MPLMPGRSKKAFSKNVATEMEHGKPQPQALAIAYSVKRKAGKRHKMAEGGSISAKTEKRPMPDQSTDSKAMVSRNSGNKAPSHDSWIDNSTVTQAQSNNGRMVKPIKRPSMVPTNAFSTRLYDEEGNLQKSASPGPYGEQPPKHDDELDAKKMGSNPDMADEHSTRKKPYRKEIENQYSEDESSPDMRRNIGGYAKGGEVEAQDYDHKAKNKYEDDLLDLPPSEDEGLEMADSHNEADRDMEGKGPDMEEPHNDEESKVYGYARGGEVSPHDEEQEEHHDSIAAAIMARRERLHAEIDSGAHDLDEAVRMAEGGEILEKSGRILSHGSMDSDDSDQADLSRNHDEDANEEDQASFNALRKENYNDSNLDVENPSDSGETGDEREDREENKLDTVSAIRSKMKSRRQF